MARINGWTASSVTSTARFCSMPCRAPRPPKWGRPMGEKPAGGHLYARRTVYSGAELRGGRARCVSGDPDRSPGHGLAPADHGSLPGGDHERPHAAPALGEPQKPGEPAALSWACERRAALLDASDVDGDALYVSIKHAHLRGT